VVVTTLAYPASALRSPLTGSGFLVPRTQGALLTACTFASNKWPHWAAPGSVVLRVSAGRSGDDRALQLDDGPLVDRLQAELVRMLGLGARPTEARVSRWIDGFPQYDVGHLDRVARIEAALSSSLPSVVVAGSAYRGLGIPACIASASAATGRLLEQLGRLG
jgi:oxygen-dependent protoporphyrinogen oxidase